MPMQRAHSHHVCMSAWCRFDLFDKEARRLLAKRLPIPAYDHLLKLSHTFNILDARGAVGVTERANCFATMRALAREVTGEGHRTSTHTHTHTGAGACSGAFAILLVLA